MSHRLIAELMIVAFVVGGAACAPVDGPEASADAAVPAPTVATVDAPETATEETTAATPAGGISITVDVSGFRNSDGMAQVTLFDKEDDFLSEDSATSIIKRVEIESGKATCQFDGVMPGDYAIALMHDEDNDGEMKKNLIGLPKEGIGMSNDAKPKFGPPKWEDAVFTVGDEDLTLAISMLYM